MKSEKPVSVRQKSILPKTQSIICDTVLFEEMAQKCVKVPGGKEKVPSKEFDANKIVCCGYATKPRFAHFTLKSDNIPARSFALLNQRFIRFGCSPLACNIARPRLACFVNTNVEGLTYHAFFPPHKNPL